MNMINIEWHGSRGCHDQADTDRARRAAEAVLDLAGVADYAALAAEVRARIDEGRDVPPVWIVAEVAANRAATKGWSNPHDVLITISA